MTVTTITNASDNKNIRTSKIIVISYSSFGQGKKAKGTDINWRRVNTKQGGKQYNTWIKFPYLCHAKLSSDSDSIDNAWWLRCRVLQLTMENLIFLKCTLISTLKIDSFKKSCGHTERHNWTISRIGLLFLLNVQGGSKMCPIHDLFKSIYLWNVVSRLLLT